MKRATPQIPARTWTPSPQRRQLLDVSSQASRRLRPPGAVVPRPAAVLPARSLTGLELRAMLIARRVITPVAPGATPEWTPSLADIEGRPCLTIKSEASSEEERDPSCDPRPTLK